MAKRHTHFDSMVVYDMNLEKKWMLISLKETTSLKLLGNKINNNKINKTK